jgi:hypothetical protein
VLDTWRYVKPESRWASWASRALKVGAVLIVVRAPASQSQRHKDTMTHGTLFGSVNKIPVRLRAFVSL